VGSDWRPYTLGHWAHTKRYGWTWISDEPFGWAAYHYGRWGYDREIGWYWRPGHRWAPAWVSWRRGTDYIVWAPLPPSDRDDDVDVSISITVGDIPDFYWVAVPARRFLSNEIHDVVVYDRPEIRRAIERTEFVGAPRITNNIVVNNVIDVDVVAEITGQEVKTVEVRETDDPRKARASGEELTVFRSDVAREENARPKEVKEVSEVKKVKRSGDEGEAAGTEPIPAPDAGQSTTAAPEDATPGQPPAGTASESGSEQQPAKKQAKEQPVEGQPEQQPAKKQAKDQPAEGQPEQQPAKKQAKENAAEPADEATGTTSAPAEDVQGQGEAQGQGKGKGKASGEKQNRGKQKKECDTDADPDCAAAQ
jgi:hypothetical protein